MVKCGFVAQREVEPNEPGSPVKIVYRYVEDDGYGHLEETDKVDMQAYMDAVALTTALPVLIVRYLNGETDVLSKAQGFYGDVTAAPHSLAEAYQMVGDAHALYDALDPTVRDKFGSFDAFCECAGSPDWFQAFDSAVPDSPAVSGTADASGDAPKVD